MKEGHYLEILLWKRTKVDNEDANQEILLETEITNNLYLTGDEVIERLRLIHDALEEYKDPASNINSNDILEDMRQGVDWLIIEACKIIECEEC